MRERADAASSTRHSARWLGRFAIAGLVGCGLLSSPSPVEAGEDALVDIIADSVWSEECESPARKDGEAASWTVFSQTEWCEEFVGDFGRVHSRCRPVKWRHAGANRYVATFGDDGESLIVELVAPNRISVFDRQAGRQIALMGRAVRNERVETLHLRCR